MPQPHIPPAPEANGTGEIARVERPTPAPRHADEDSSGRALAVQLPDWDLVPPTEFLNRPRGS